MKMGDVDFVKKDFNSKCSMNATVPHAVWCHAGTIIVKELI